MSVYCKDCVHFDGGISSPHSMGPPDWIHELCNSPSNYKDTYWVDGDHRISTPRILNKGNNCTWFTAIIETVSSSSSGS
jgi:hypothetical protein